MGAERIDTIVLAGGFATRLLPLTGSRAKPLLKVAGKTILDYLLPQLRWLSRLGRIYLTTNIVFADQIRGWLDSQKDVNILLEVEKSRREEEKLGSIGAVSSLIDKHGLENGLLVVAGDNLFSYSLSGLVAFYKNFSPRLPVLVAYDVGSLEVAKRYGVLTVRNGAIESFEEKPAKPRTSLISTGCYLFPPSVLPRFGEYLAGGGNRDAPGHFISWLSKRERIHCYTPKGVWFDIGGLDSYLEANKHFLGGKSLIEKPATIKGENKIERSYIMSNSHIENSWIINSVVYENTTIKNSRIVSSVVDKDCVIQNTTIENRIVGEKSRVVGVDVAPEKTLR
ncbi:MAG: NDP-sugar synthase [Candidatus Hydrothermarchaeota archaeon]|nr:MAG: NDP-sugar synthase [Candidatus Hydrothermarchaeota archaeon]